MLQCLYPCSNKINGVLTDMSFHLFRQFNPRFAPDNLARNQAIAGLVRQMARDRDCSPAQLALKFVYSRWFVASTIIGATSLAQLEENLNAWEAPWSEALEQAVADIRLRWFNPAP